MKGASTFWGAAFALLSPCVSRAQEIEFQRDVWPVLEARCVECHRAPYEDDRGRLRRPKAGLRLDGKAWILRGTESEKVLVPGDSKGSSLIRRISLDADHPDVMPPKGDPLKPAEVERLRAWVDGGAEFGSWVGAPGPEVRAKEGDESSSRGAERLQVFERLASGLRPLPEDRIAQLAGERARITPLHEGSPLLRVEFPSFQEEIDDRFLRTFLPPLAEHVAILDLSRTKVGDRTLQEVARLTRLVELDLHSTAIGSGGIAALANLANLRVLNLHHTQVEDGVVGTLASLASLRRVYLWGTQVSEEAVARLRSVRADLRVQHRIELPEPPAPVEEPEARRRRRN